MSFRITANAIRDTSITNVYEKIVLVVLSDFADDETSESFPSVKTICERAAISERTVQRALRALEESGHIETRERAYKSSIYRLRTHDKPLEKKRSDEVSESHRIRRPVDTTPPSEGHRNRSSNKPVETSSKRRSSTTTSSTPSGSHPPLKRRRRTDFLPSRDREEHGEAIDAALVEYPDLEPLAFSRLWHQYARARNGNLILTHFLPRMTGPDPDVSYEELAAAAVVIGRAALPPRVSTAEKMIDRWKSGEKTAETAKTIAKRYAIDFE